MLGYEKQFDNKIGCQTWLTKCNRTCKIN